MQYEGTTIFKQTAKTKVKPKWSTYVTDDMYPVRNHVFVYG